MGPTLSSWPHLTGHPIGNAKFEVFISASLSMFQLVSRTMGLGFELVCLFAVSGVAMSSSFIGVLELVRWKISFLSILMWPMAFKPLVLRTTCLVFHHVYWDVSFYGMVLLLENLKVSCFLSSLRSKLFKRFLKTNFDDLFIAMGCASRIASCINKTFCI